ncbi:hypothetical protein FIBSPDRAFT_276043 [Athelia psychrophila]|uniref:Ubiquitin-like protease family profile domain-containing protein n=1 Tax=Athelia psychrophila TaxID=1759441 RepID=A0A166REK9_9AGAM|nr:hypothetical protein FIBSPDRAFT_276043 [Fibularhizoctonia sp. CBS 109695]
MTSRRSFSRRGNRALKLDVIGTIPLACMGDAFRWDRKGIRTLAKHSKYLEVEGLWDWPKTAERELRAGLIVGAQSPQDAYEGPWNVELLKKHGISGTDEGLFYDFKQLGLALVNDADNSSEPHPEKVPAMEVFGHLGIWGLDVPTTYDAGVPPWVRKQWVPARDASGSRLDRVEVRSKGWWSGVHVNEGGCVVGIEQSYGRQILFYSEMNVPNEQAVKWLKKSLHQYKYANTGPWRHTVLEPGTFVIIPPAKPHAIYSLEKSIASVQLWYQVDALPLTEVSNQLDAPPAPHQSKPDAQPALTAIAQAALDDGYENIDTAALQALCRLLHAPSTADSDEDFGDVVVLEDSEADDVDEPDYSHVPGITREPLDKVELLKRLETDMKDRPQAPQHSPTRNNFRSYPAQVQIREPHINPVHVKLRSKSPANASPLVLSYPAGDPHPVQICQRDCETLRLGVTAPLTPTLVEFGIKYWIHQLASTNPALAAQIYLFSPLFYTRLSSPEHGYPGVEKWGDAADMAASAFIIVPICVKYVASLFSPICFPSV